MAFFCSSVQGEITQFYIAVEMYMINDNDTIENLTESYSVTLIMKTQRKIFGYKMKIRETKQAPECSRLYQCLH